jgi:hypothetical protein
VISNREGALLATALLVDLGIVTQKDTRLVVDANRIARARTKFRQKCVKEHKVGFLISSSVLHTNL